MDNNCDYTRVISEFNPEEFDIDDNNIILVIDADNLRLNDEGCYEIIG